MNERSLNFLRQTFSSYYSSQRSMWAPTEIEKREFGFFLGKEKVMIRHKSFRNVETLLNFIVNEVPFDVYYSVATYDYPEEEMSKKGWRYADIVFDIDADHLEHRCKDEHDIWVCNACKKEGRGTKPPSCPNCRKKELSEINWICDQCLGLAKLEVYKLIEILTEDFGIRYENIDVYFSGHRGYHVHVQGSLSTIDQLARKELIDYLTGVGMDLGLQELLSTTKVSKRLLPGWGTRVARSLYELVNDSWLDGKLNGDRKVTVKRKQRILEELMENNIETLSRTLDGRSFESLLASAIERVSVKVDPVVTTDIHRLFRLPETLNSKTGFLKKEVPQERLANFDPLREAAVLRGDPMKVSVRFAPKFSLSGESYGPYNDEVVTVPKEVAVLLICKEVAECL
ncbi:MAG: DNA primase small subunit domain-containing protein [Thermoproteota archaeon]